MTTETTIQQALELLGPLAQGAGATRPEPERIDLSLPATELETAVRALAEGGWGYLSAITGLDHPSSNPEQPEGSLEALYHLCEGEAVLTIRVNVPHSNPVLPSICGIIPSATLYERELIEMFGLTITGTPCTDHFILPEDWPAGVFPLRKDFSGFPEPKEEAA